MRAALVAASTVAIVALLLPAPAPGQDRPRAGRPTDARELEATLVDLAARARASTVLIYGVIGLGSGAIVDPSGLVVTNAHVVAGARYALVQWPDGTSGLARQRGIDYTRDLAVLEPLDAQPRRAALSLAPRRPAAGSWVVALGFPGGLQTTDSPTVSLGRVLEGAGDGPAGPALDYSQALRHDAPIFSGNSGGPLLDLEGRLVGINGAVDLERAVSLTIPADVVADRLETLRGGVIVLPGGRRLDPEETPLLRALHRLLDPLARRLPEQVAEASRNLVQEERLPRVPALGPVEFDAETADRLAVQARTSPRAAVLDALHRAPPASVVVALAGDGLAARVGPEHAVCKASFLPATDRDHVTLADGARAPILARSAPDDLVLFRAPPGEAAPDAPLRPVGSLVQARGARAIVASGIVSAAPRRASATLAAQVRGGGVPEPVERAIEGFARLVERTGAGPIKELVEQLRQAIEQRKAFAAGTPPRGYARVLSVDAPVRPSHMGAPVCDRDGRLIGVTIGVQHHGTTFVVPMTRIREVFAAELPGERWPERVGPARLF